MVTPVQTLRLRLIYRGAPPVHWTGGARDFGVQDKDNRLLAGHALEDGGLAFDFSVTVKPATSAAPVLVGAFAHGPPAERFVYLSWRNADGAYAQRFKLPLDAITADQVDHALGTGQALTAVLAVPEQRATTTGANIGGMRRVEWR
jgi:hypothetical protein